MAQDFKVAGVLSLDDEMSDKLKKASANVGTFAQKAGSSLQAVGKKSTVLGLAVGAMAGKAIKSYGDFQESINKAAIIAGSSNKKLGSNMKDLEKVALSLGKTLPISAEDAGNAMIEMARNGASIKDLKTEFPAIAKAAAVSGTDLAATATTVQQAMNIWGGGARNAAKDSAILAIVANKSNAEVGDMQQVFANVGTTAKNMGYSLKDVAIAAGVMTNAGIPAAQASMDLNHAFTQMVKPSKTAQGEMEKLGLSYTNAQGEMKPLKTIIKDVANATKGMSGAQKTAALNMLFGAAGAKAMAPLLDSVGDKAKKSGKGWDAFSSAIDKGAGSAKKANKYLSENSQNMTKNVGQSLAQMVDAFDALVKTSIGSIAPQIRAVADALGDFATWLNNSKSPLAGFVRKMIALTPIIAGVLIVFGLLSTGVGKLISAFSAPAKALGDFSKGTKTAGKNAGASAGKIATMGTKALGIGVGIGAAALGIGVLAVGIAVLAKTGKKGLVVLAAMTGAIVILAATFAILKGPLTAAIPAMVALSAAVLAVGTAVAIASVGIALVSIAFTALAGAGTAGLLVIAAMTGAIIAIVAAFGLLAPVLTANITGLVAFSAAVVAVGAAMLAAGASALMIGGAISLVGLGIKLAAQGVMILVQAFTLLSQNMTVIIPIMTAVGQGFAMMIVGFVTTLASHIPQVSLAIVTMMLGILTTINAYMPQLMQQGTLLIVNFLNGLAAGMPQIILAATNLIVNFLNALTTAIPRIAEAGTNLVVALVAAIGANAPRLMAAGIALIGQLAEAFVTQLPLLVQIMGATMAAVIAVITTYVSAFKSIGGVLMGALKAGLSGKKFDVAGESAKIIKDAGTTASENGKAAFDAAGGNSAIAAAQAISGKKGNAKSAGSSLAGAGANGVKGKQGQFKSSGSGNGSAAASGIGSKSGEAKAAGGKLGSSGASGAKGKSGSFKSAGSFLGQGLVDGVRGMAGSVMAAAAGLASAAATKIKSVLKIHSPSRVTRGLGSYTGQGFVLGLKDQYASVQGMSDRIANAAIPDVNKNALANNINGINKRMQAGISGTLNSNISLNQPAQINLNLGGSNYKAFVGDITQQQNVDLTIDKNYSL